MPGIKVKAADGGEFDAYLATPASGRGAAVMVIQEIFGVNPWVRGVCDGLATQGYLAVAPDLFWRLERGIELDSDKEDEFQQAFGYMQKFDFGKGIGDLAATVAHARRLDGASGKVGAVGYCLGGSLAYLVGCNTDADASVGYYPVQIDNQLEQAAKIRHPVLLHIAEQDKFCPPEAQAKIKTGLAGNALVTIHTYPGADHGFARDGSHAYNKPAAELANQRSAEFFRRHLA